MLRYLRHPDAGIILLNFVFTVGSMALSAYCGWLLATDQGEIIQWACAVMFSGFAFGLGLAVSRRERYRLSKDRAGYARSSLAVFLFLIANAVTDFSAGSAIRDLSVNNVDNKNVVATNARKEVMRIESRLAQLTNDGTITLRPSSFYAAQVAAKTEELRQESFKGCRQPPCRGPNYLKDMEEIASLEDLRSTSAEVEALNKALPGAKAAVKDTPKAGNPAMAPIIKILQIVTGTLDNTADDKTWGLNYFVLVSTLIFTGGIYCFSAELGVRSGPMPAPIPQEEWRPPARNRWLEAPEGYQPPQEPIALKAEDPPPRPGTRTDFQPQSFNVSQETQEQPTARTTTSTTINVSGARPDPKAIDRLIDMLEEDFGIKAPSARVES